MKILFDQFVPYVEEALAPYVETVSIDGRILTPEDVATASAEDMNAYYSVQEQEKYGVVGIEIVKD